MSSAHAPGSHPAPGPSATPPSRHGPSRGLLVGYAVAVGLALLAAIFLGVEGRDGLTLFGNVPFAFVLFALVLLGVALFHAHALLVALGGAVALTVYTLWLRPTFGATTGGMLGHLGHETVETFLNLGGLLVGFALLAKTFEASGVPEHLPRLLPKEPRAAAFALLGIVFLLSGFLDNIAAAIIGGVIARTAFQGRVTIGYLAAIVAASNAGGAGSVVGDTTTTMMWIKGVPALRVAPAYLASAAALVVFGIPAALAQTRRQPIVRDASASSHPIDGTRVGITILILAGAITTNVLLDKPFIGVWAAILLGALLRRPAWEEVPGAAKGAAFLLSLVWCASLMPVESLPPASWPTTLGLGFVSSLFDNIPLTRLALDQGGYDWALLAFSVGFGGSMLWFGSSAGVAISKDFPEARDTKRWLAESWWLPLAVVVGFFVQLAVIGWNADQPRPPLSSGP